MVKPNLFTAKVKSAFWCFIREHVIAEDLLEIVENLGIKDDVYSQLNGYMKTFEY